MPFCWTGMKTDLFQSCGHCWVFQICWHIGCTTFTASSFRILNSSAGTPSPALALFIVMLPKAHLTSHTRISGSRWVIKTSWLSGSWRSFFYSSSVYSCQLFFISSVSVQSIPSLSFTVPIFAWNIPVVSLIFLKRSLVFSIRLFFSISLHLSLRKTFLSLLPILWNSAFRWIYLSFIFCLSLLFFFQLFCKASSGNHFSFTHFFFLGIILSLPPIQCYKPPSTVLQELYLSDLIPWINLSLPLYNCKEFDLVHIWMV